MLKLNNFMFLCIIIVVGCSEKQETGLLLTNNVQSVRLMNMKELHSPCFYESLMLKHGLIDIQQLDATIQVDLIYARADNFLSKNVYGCLQKSYLIPEIAAKLQKAQRFLRIEYPEYSLIVYDAARPLEVQQLMWDMLDMPVREKVKYLSNPVRGSVHNYGCAVDVSILAEGGKPIDMGTEVDYFGILAQPIMEQYCLEKGLLTTEQYKNRLLLRRIMRNAGFSAIEHEWWHFNGMSRMQAMETLPILK